MLFRSHCIPMALVLVCVFATMNLARADTVRPGDFNVYSLSGIGSAQSQYGSDIQGVVGAAEDAYFAGFTLTGLKTVDGKVLFSGRSVLLNGGDFNGGIDVNDNVVLQSFSTGGDVISGGNVQATGGTISGSVRAAGSIDFFGASATGTVSPNTPHTSPINYNAMNDYFRDTSAEIAGWSNTGSITDNWGGLSASVGSGMNVLSIDADTLKKAWGFTLTGPEDAVVYINVTGTDVTLDWLNWSFSGGIGASDVLLNYNEADAFALNMGGTTNILAPNANMTYSSGVWTGSIVAGYLEGGGQVNLGGFDHYHPIPEPASISILIWACFLLPKQSRRKRRP